MSIAEDLVAKIAVLDSSAADLFNPYSDICSSEDHNDSPGIRRENLIRYFVGQLEKKPEYLWVCEAPGYRGCRRTGLALISENLLEKTAKDLGLDGPFRQATKTGPVAEYSANAVWGMIDRVPGIPLVWNAYPLHPFKKGDPLTNRRPRKAEIEAGRHILMSLVEIFQPRVVVAVGRVAEELLGEQGLACTYVRHPANGGLGKFRRGIAEVYNC
ncbi:uracil-DNA glycosylase [Candidatus Parcubacteria bacterium]|nr:uracil-DNA glycosylase [Candidatus Parcubacteria bacterium]